MNANASTMTAAAEAFETYLRTSLLRLEADVPVLPAASQYSLRVPGKRMRPLFTMAAGDLFGASRETSMRLGLAMECIHTYSLIHDDLPCMDDDDLRRGEPTNHKVHGEANALLAGNVLLTEAFALLVAPDAHLSPAQQVDLVRETSIYCGLQGLLGGQAMDINSSNAKLDATTLEKLHLRKTAALLTLSIISGAIAGKEASATDIERMRRLGAAVGLAFQIKDDLLDLAQDEGANQDDKPSYPVLVGVAHAEARAQELTLEAIDLLAHYPGDKADLLRTLVHRCINRDF